MKPPVPVAPMGGGATDSRAAEPWSAPPRVRLRSFLLEVRAETDIFFLETSVLLWWCDAFSRRTVLQKGPHWPKAVFLLPAFQRPEKLAVVAFWPLRIGGEVLEDHPDCTNFSAAPNLHPRSLLARQPCCACWDLHEVLRSNRNRRASWLGHGQIWLAWQEEPPEAGEALREPLGPQRKLCLSICLFHMRSLGVSAAPAVRAKPGQGPEVGAARSHLGPVLKAVCVSC